VIVDEKCREGSFVEKNGLGAAVRHARWKARGGRTAAGAVLPHGAQISAELQPTG